MFCFPSNCCFELILHLGKVKNDTGGFHRSLSGLSQCYIVRETYVKCYLGVPGSLDLWNFPWSDFPLVLMLIVQLTTFLYFQQNGIWVQRFNWTPVQSGSWFKMPNFNHVRVSHMCINVEGTPVYFLSKYPKLRTVNVVKLVCYILQYTAWKHLHATCGKLGGQVFPHVWCSFYLYANFGFYQVLWVRGMCACGCLLMAVERIANC